MVAGHIQAFGICLSATVFALAMAWPVNRDGTALPKGLGNGAPCTRTFFENMVLGFPEVKK